ncbi:ribosome assembly RNA-binding protein YhbY [Guyparkeria sp.]|uniref:ribosome assembly RNA-binding protein YhbY n=1 Tax=Guyparkeria sp. TaxID=2035736 RepID=UPI003970987F
MNLTARQRQYLRAEAHHLKPVVLLGQHGLTEAVLLEIEQALEIHELIKVRVPGVEREEKREIINAIIDATKATLVQTVGHIAVLFRSRASYSDFNLPKPGKAPHQ